MVGLGKIFGRPGQFLKAWKKIINVREKISEKMYGKKSRGSKILATRGRGDFVKFYLFPPQNACCPSNAPPNSETWRRHCVQQFMRMRFFGQCSFCDVILKLQGLLEQLKSSVLLNATAILVRTSKHFVLACETFHMAIYACKVLQNNI